MKIKTLNPFNCILAALAVLFAVPEVIILGLSMAKIVIFSWMAAASLGLGLLLAILTWFRLRPSAPEVEDSTLAWHRWVFYGLVGLLGLVYLALWYAAYLSPEITCDGTAYHIPAISMWAQRGYVYWIDPCFQLESLVNGYPKSVELFAFVLIRATGFSELTNTLNLLFLPFGVLGLASLARSLGASKPAALLSGALWVLIPVNIFQAATAYIDSAYGSLAIAFIALLISIFQALRTADKMLWRLALPFGAVAGLTLAAKGSALLMVAVGFGGLLLAALAARIVARHTSRGVIGRALLIVLVAGTITIAVGGFWYVRNYITTGTPLYPVGISVGDRVIFPGIKVSEALYEENNMPAFMKPWRNTERIAFTWTQTLYRDVPGVPGWPRNIMWVDSRIGGLGFLWLVGCIPAILYALVSSLVLARKKPERFALWLVLAVVALSFLGSPMNFWARYTVWIYALGLPALALALTDLLAARRWWFAPASMWLLFSLGLGLYEGGVAFARALDEAYPGFWPPKTLQAWLPHAWRWRDGYLFPETRGTAMESVMASNGPIAVGVLLGNAPGGRWQHNIYGQLAEPIGQRELMFLTDNMTVALSNTLKERKPLYIIWDGNRELPDWVRTLAERVDQTPGFWVVTMKPFDN
jgi:hypothetical protein